MIKSKPKHVLSALDLCTSQVKEICERGIQLKKSLISKEPYAGSAEGSTIGVLFFEASTRTRLSFEKSAMRLKCDTIGFADVEVSRAGSSWGESLSDTARSINGYADAIVVRHEAVQEYAHYSSVPVINAGDGWGDLSEHPTQGLTDLVSLQSDFGTIDGLNVVLMTCPTSRSAHSLVLYLSNFKNVTITLAMEPGKRLPEKIEEVLNQSGIKYRYVTRLDGEIDQADVLYLAGLEGKDVPPDLVITHEKLASAQKHLKVYHCLPRGDELPYDVDDSPHASYFQQAANGVPARMALLEFLLDGG